MSKMIYLSAVNPIAHACILNGSASSGICPVFGSTPITSPVKSGVTQTHSVIKRTAYVQKYMHTCAHVGGSPLFLVSWFTRILKARNNMANIGAKATVWQAVRRIFWMGTFSYLIPKASAPILQIARAVYTIMNWMVRLTTHCIAVVTPLVLNCPPTTGTSLTLFTTSIGSPSVCRNACWAYTPAPIRARSITATFILFLFCLL